MKRERESISWLLARHSLPWVGWSILLMFLLEFVVFFICGKIQDIDAPHFSDWADGVVFYFYRFFVAFLAYYTGKECMPINAKYTLLRLGIKTKELFILLFANTLCCLMILWATQAIILMCGFAYYIWLSPEGMSNPQTLFLDAIRSDHMATVFPMTNVLLWIRVFMQFLLLSLASAQLKIRECQGKKQFAYIFIMIAMIFMTIPNTTISNWIAVVISGICVAISWKGGRLDEEIT